MLVVYSFTVNETGSLIVFSVQVRTVQYPMLQSETALPRKSGEDDPRVPWEVLVSLFERMPVTNEQNGDLACVCLRVKEQYDAANDWQKQISSMTMLSLRGGKKRIQAAPSSLKENEAYFKESPALIELEKVSELCHHPILSKVGAERQREALVTCFHYLTFVYQGGNA